MNDTPYTPLHTWGSDTPRILGIVLHGRGAHPEPLLQLAAELADPGVVRLYAPTAPGYVWYPERFIVPQADNEPALSEALGSLDSLITAECSVHQLTRENVVLFGFSQGACLAAEFLRRYPARYRQVVVCSGGLIGNDAEAAGAIAASLEGTPVYLGCDAQDHHIPWSRVETTAAVLTAANADVTLRQYHGLGHTIHQEAQAMLRRVLQDQ